jgi:general secretion pathway protein C
MIGRLKNWLGGGALYFLLDLALVAAIAASLAHWTWVALTPRASAAPAVTKRTDLPAAATVKPHLFGQGTAADAAFGSKLRLVGVLSPGVQGAGRAIFALENGKSTTVATGETITSGLVLREVHPDHVLVSHNGAIERFRLDRRVRR